MELEPLPVPRSKSTVVAAPDAPEPDPATAARTGAIAGNQAIISGDFLGAVDILATAQRAATDAGELQMAAEISLDKARALMMLGRFEDADATLEHARTDLPGNAHAWVVSAVNARRMENFDKAERLIAEALSFAPNDPGVGLEAGILAYMAGDDASALRHWRSVIENADASAEARIAEQYLAAIEEPDPEEVASTE